MRESGILLPVTSLPSPYGIGTMGKLAYQWIDFLKIAKQNYWQVLPLGPTSYGDSPYQTFSGIAGNPYLIDLDMLVEEGLLVEDEILQYKDLPLSIDYGNLYGWRFDVLKSAYHNFKPNSKYNKFIKENESWLKDYALFMSLKKHFNDVSWQEWPAEYKLRKPEVILEFEINNTQEIKYWYFLQYMFYQQWGKLKKYANKNGVKIIGDIPIYVALDSADVWSNPSIFQLDKDLKPKRVAGCPPDAFTPLGQLWGNPLYDYKKMAQNGYEWWINRIKYALVLYDVIRIDHFRGFEAYYSIPVEDDNAINGVWKKGPGMDLFSKVKEALPQAKIIAEDLGFLTPGVYKLLKDTGFPGMKILEFAFDVDSDSEYMPHNYDSNCVVYTGTHDNLPVRAWFETVTPEEKHIIREYLSLSSDDKVCDRLIRCALASKANLAIIPIQDYLGLGIESRINTPSTKTNNWVWRLEEKHISVALAEYIGFLTKLYKRTKLEKKDK